MTNTTNLVNDDRPRAVQNGMSQEEYDTWMFLADKKGLEEPYTFAIKQSDLTKFIHRQQQKAVRELKDDLKRLSDEWGLPDFRTWRRGRFIDQPQYNRMGADWKREQELREVTLIRPHGGTNNALFQISGAEDNAKIVAYISEVASLLNRLDNKPEDKNENI